MIKKLISVLAACTMIISGAAACAKSSPAVMTYGDSVITEAMYTYYVSTYKGRYINAYDDITDTDEFWLGEIKDGVTGEDVVSELIYGNVAQNLVAAEEFRKAGLKLSESDTNEVDDYIESMTDELASGSRKTLNGYLSEFGVNVNILRDIFLMEVKAQRYFEYLYGEGGSEAIGDSDREEYFSENYVRFQQIYINNIDMYETDEDGYYIQDENGNYKKRDFTDEELAEIQSRIDAVRDGLEAGEDFDTLKEKYSDSKDYDKGYYFSVTTSTNYITSVVSAAFALEEGQWTYVEAAEDKGAFFIKRLPLEDGAYNDEDCKDFFEDFDEIIASEKYSEKIEGFFGDIIRDEDYLDSVSVREAAPNYNFY